MPAGRGDLLAGCAQPAPLALAAAVALEERASLSRRIFKRMQAIKPAHQPIRIWSAGCASGEEAYSLAVLFAEALGEDRFRQCVKIYATDADADALAGARHGRYRDPDLLEAFGEERANRFFERDGSYSVFRSDLRRALIFGRHDLVQDPPISRIDLITCRNTLMYFTAEVQAKVLTSFHFALDPGGYLFLGKSEALVTRTQMFEVVDLRQHIVRKSGDGSDIALLASQPSGRPVKSHRHIDSAQVSGAAFEQNISAQVVLDTGANIVLANRAARRTFSLGSADLGRHLRDVELSFRPTDLRNPVDRVLRERRPVTIYDVSWPGPGDEPMTLDIVVSPLDSAGGVLSCTVNLTCLSGGGTTRGVILMMDAGPREDGKPDGRGTAASGPADQAGTAAGGGRVREDSSPNGPREADTPAR